MTRDQLDDAIDAVAARLTHVDDNDGLSTRILESLPDRSRWNLHWLMPRLVMTTAVGMAVALVVLRTFDGRSTDVLRTFDERSTDVLRSAVLSLPTVELATAAPEHRTIVELPLIVRRTTVERSSNDRRTTADFDRSLAAIASPLPLALGAVEPSDLPGQTPLIVAPLAIADLPLTAENNVPR